jgi:uncharacterized protein
MILHRAHAARLTGCAVAGALLLSACMPAPQRAGEVRPGGVADGLPLWEVTHGGSTLYLLGSVHLLRPDVYPLDDGLYAAFDAAGVVAFELDFADLAEAGSLMMERGGHRDGRTLRDVVPAELYAQVEARAEAIGLPVTTFDRMKPWMAALTLSSLALRQAGFEAVSGIDLHFHERAVRAGKTVVGLETLADQIDVFDGLDPAAQAALLRATLEQLDVTVSDLDRATRLWRRGDTEGLAAMSMASLGDQPVLVERLLHARNRAWIPHIEALLAGPETAMVIVGVGHLVGRGSVVELLRQRGYRVIQLGAVSAAGDERRGLAAGDPGRRGVTASRAAPGPGPRACRYPSSGRGWPRTRPPAPPCG